MSDDVVIDGTPTIRGFGYDADNGVLEIVLDGDRSNILVTVPKWLGEYLVGIDVQLEREALFADRLAELLEIAREHGVDQVSERVDNLLTEYRRYKKENP